jgi:hypothetical protein
MNPPTPSLEPVAVLVMLSATLFSPEAAAVAGPYLAIFLASSLGAYYRLGQREDTPEEEARAPASRWSALMFFVMVNVGALLFTVPLSMLIQGYLPKVQSNWLLVPMAFAIGLTGERWPAIGNWAARRAARILDVLLRNKTGGNP